MFGVTVHQFPTGFHFNIIFTILEGFILCIPANYLIVRALINLTMSAPLIRRRSSDYFVFFTYFSLVRNGSNIVLNICGQNVTKKNSDSIHNRGVHVKENDWVVLGQGFG
jgi:hypothetical protein